MSIKIATIINYCTVDYPFIKPCIDHVLPFSNQVIVPICSHLFNGDPENKALMLQSFDENPDAQFISYNYRPQLSKKYGTQFWCNLARWIGLNAVSEDCDYVLFLDSDEIIDTKQFIHWLDNDLDPSVDSYKFLMYWYFRELNNQATTLEDGTMLVKKDKIGPKHIFTSKDRHAYVIGKHQSNTTASTVDALVHHYSWVRSKEQLLNKVRNWGHNNDKNWIDLIEEEYSRLFNGTDFVHGYSYNSVDPLISVNLEPPNPQNVPQKKRANVLHLSDNLLSSLIADHTYGLGLKSKLKKTLI